MKNEILYKILLSINDLFFPPSAVKQAERYKNRYGIPDKTLVFIGKGFHTDFYSLKGRDFYQKIKELGETPFMQKLQKDIREKGSFTMPGHY